MEFTVYLAAKGFVKELVYELGDAIEVADRLVFAPGPPRPAAWAQNIWLNPRRIPIESITDASNKLRALQRNWSLFSVRHHRRAKLIEEKLPAVSPKPVRIGTPPPTAPLGSWTLLDKDVVVASPACSSPFPHGEVLFLENKQDPPSRAYLKLWELFTLLGQAPSPDSFCLDLGGSPGGWTWVLASLGCKVLSVDKAPLEAKVEAMPGVEFRQLSAFALDPREVGPVDWLFSDVVCYPDRLWRLVDRWRTFGKVKNFVCTLKFQGATDHETAAKFAAWPGARLVHLFNNKHELTWVLLGDEEAQAQQSALAQAITSPVLTGPDGAPLHAPGESSEGRTAPGSGEEEHTGRETPATADGPGQEPPAQAADPTDTDDGPARPSEQEVDDTVEAESASDNPGVDESPAGQAPPPFNEPSDRRPDDESAVPPVDNAAELQTNPWTALPPDDAAGLENDVSAAAVQRESVDAPTDTLADGPDLTPPLPGEQPAQAGTAAAARFLAENSSAAKSAGADEKAAGIEENQKQSQ